MKHEEHAIQCAVVEWCKGPGSNRYPGLEKIIAVPNSAGLHGGFKANAVRVVRALKSGTAKGFPDLFLPVARGTYHGAMIEMKAPKGRTSPEQKQWLSHLEEEGYFVKVAFSAQEATDYLAGYMRDAA